MERKGLVIYFYIIYFTHATALGNVCNSQGLSLIATEEPAEIQSPGYPDNYGNNHVCKWVIEAEKKYQVVRFKILDMDIQYTAGCQSDYLQLQDGSGAGALVMKKCCKNVCATNYVETTYERDCLVTFKSDNSQTDSGFRLRYWAVTKTGEDFSPVKLHAINYLLMGLFTCIIASVGLTILFIYIMHSYPSVANRLSNLIRRNTCDNDTALNNNVIVKCKNAVFNDYVSSDVDLTGSTFIKDTFENV